MVTAERLKARFRARGLRVTPQRELLFSLLEAMQADHPTAEALYVRAARQRPSISLRTVYAILKDLEAVGAIRPLDVGTGSTRYCATPVAHPHAVCLRCGRVTDVDAEVGPLELPPERRQGFVITEREVVFRGLCARCR